MNIFGIGFSEFFIIFLIALMILGPQRLPVYANKLGAKIREWRMMSQVFMVEWKEELAALEEARTSLEEAKQALVEAQEVVTTEVQEVTETVVSEVQGAQQDISAELNEAQNLVSDESNQVKETISEVAKGTDNVSEAKNISDVDGADAVTAPSDIDAETVAIEDDIAEISGDVSDVLDIDEDDLSDVIETRSIAPPKMAQQHANQVAALDEIDVSEVQTVSDVASDVAEQVAQRVAAEVAKRVTKNLTSDMAEEVAALVMAKLAEAGINGNNAAEADAVEISSEPTILQEVVNE